MKGKLAVLAILACTTALARAPAAKPPSNVVKQIATIRMPGNGFADYLFVDPTSHTLFAGYTSQGALVVMDTRTNTVRKVIENLPGCHTIAMAPGAKLGYSSNGRSNSVGVIDLASYRVLRTLPGGVGPDAIIYDHAAKLVYVADHRGKTATLIDPATEKVVATVALGGTAEYAADDPKTGVVYQNLEDASEVVAVDPKKHAVVARFKTAPGAEPTGLALDAKGRRLFSACGNEKLVVLNQDTGKVVAALPIGSGVDFAAYDPQLRRIYTANGDSGTMTVVQQNGPDSYRVLEQVPTYRGGHALAVDVSTHRIYVVHGNEIAVYEVVKM